MVVVRVARLGAEAMAAAPSTVSVHRLSAEAAAPDTGSDEVRVARVGVEVMAASPATVNVHRFSAEAAAPDTGSDEVRIARIGVEVMMKPLAGTLAVQRLSAEAAAPDTGSDAAWISRFAVEVMAKRGIPGPVPLPLQPSSEFFAANWDNSRVQLESAYLTDITRSPTTLTEERRSLAQRPQRHMTVKWTHGGVTDLDRLVVFLRNLTSNNMQVPLYPDGSVLTANASSGATTLQLVTDYRRFFIGGRILIVPIAALADYSATPIVKEIADIISGTITLTETVGTALTAGQWIVYPYIDCEVNLSPQLAMPTDQINSVEVVFTEHKGRNSLPPVAIGLPAGWQVAPDGKPIFYPNHNWREPMQISYRRHGSMVNAGRKSRPATEGTRYVQVQEYQVTMNRAEFWDILTMFDTRAGRGRSFWAIDQETFWTLSDTDFTFIDVLASGTFSDFDQLWTDDGVGAAIVMMDGTIYLREIFSVQDNGGTWRLTIVGGQTLPDPIDLTQVAFFARARHSRFENDSLTETWYSSDAVEARFSVIETPNEATIDLDP